MYVPGPLDVSDLFVFHSRTVVDPTGPAGDDFVSSNEFQFSHVFSTKVSQCHKPLSGGGGKSASDLQREKVMRRRLPPMTSAHGNCGGMGRLRCVRGPRNDLWGGGGGNTAGRAPAPLLSLLTARLRLHCTTAAPTAPWWALVAPVATARPSLGFHPYWDLHRMGGGSELADSFSPLRI